MMESTEPLGKNLKFILMWLESFLVHTFASMLESLKDNFGFSYHRNVNVDPPYSVEAATLNLF